MKFIALGATLFAVVCSVSAFAGFSKEQKAAELQFIANIVRNQYGPLEYKSKEFRLDIDKLVEQYVRESDSLTNEEFYYQILRFVAEFKDSHFGTRVNTTHVSKLGFITDRVKGKVVIDSIERELLPVATFPFERGDEVISVAGVPVENLVQDLARYINAGNPETALRSASVLVSYRASNIAPPQTGDVTVVLKSRKTQMESHVKLKWLDEGEDLGVMKRFERPVGLNFGRSSNIPDYGSIAVDALDFLPKTEKSQRCMPTTRFAIPKDATVISKTPFVAYYHPTPKGNVGYVRIPHYAWRNAVTGANENPARLRNYEYVVNVLEKNTVGLIIDQTHNCGGQVSMVEDMVALFVDKPYAGLEFQFLATRNEYLLFKSWIATEADKLTMAAVDTEDILTKMKDSYSKGERMTVKTTFHSSFQIQPNRIRYTKPIVTLIDEMSGSGGDAFPGLMQGLGRSKLMGTRTMGAGGHVVDLAPLPLSGNTFRITKSLFYHANGKPIENLGVAPDVVYEPTLEDYVDEYRPYQQEYLKTLLEMIK